VDTTRCSCCRRATIAHLTLSFGWAIALARALPQRHGARSATLAGLAIAALDLGVIGRRFPAIRALPLAPQVADHLAYAWTVAAVLGRRRSQAKLTPRTLANKSDSRCARRICLAPGRQA
jgi:hypothetical protein